MARILRRRHSNIDFVSDRPLRRARRHRIVVDKRGVKRVYADWRPLSRNLFCHGTEVRWLGESIVVIVLLLRIYGVLPSPGGSS